MKLDCTKHPTSSARLPTPDPAPVPALQAGTCAALVSRWSVVLTHAAATSFAASVLFEDPSPHHNLDGDLPALGHLLAHSSPPCRPVACQPGNGRSGVIASLPQTHLWTGQYTNSLCLEAAQQNSFVPVDLHAAKTVRGEKTTASLPGQ